MDGIFILKVYSIEKDECVPLKDTSMQFRGHDGHNHGLFRLDQYEDSRICSQPGYVSFASGKESEEKERVE